MTNSLPQRNKVIMFIHGGAFVLNIEFATRRMGRKLAALFSGATVVAPMYDLPPEALYPSQVQQLSQFYMALVNKTESNLTDVIGFVPERVVVMGESAGSTYQLGMAQLLSYFNLTPQYMHVNYPCVVLSYTGES